MVNRLPVGPVPWSQEGQRRCIQIFGCGEAAVGLTDEERDTLKGLLNKGKIAARRVAHARILLLADAGEEDDAIATVLAVSSRTVCRIRKRLVTEGFLAALDHRPQPPRPDKV